MDNACSTVHRVEFDAFLYSVIHQEKSGVSLTMLSLLARQDLDPWDEAANYARLSGETGVTKLFDLLAGNIDDVGEGRDLRADAVALLQLLPRPSSIDAMSRGAIWPEIVRLLERVKTASQGWIRNTRR